MAGTPFSAFNPGGTLIVGDQLAGLRGGENTLFDPTITAFSISINQVGHGFVIGNPIGLLGAVYTKAQANNAANSECVGMVSSIIDADNFTLQFGGPVSNIDITVTGGGPMVVGDVYYLDPNNAGQIVNVDPAIAGVAGTVTKPVLIAYSVDAGYWYNWRGQVL